MLSGFTTSGVSSGIPLKTNWHVDLFPRPRFPTPLTYCDDRAVVERCKPCRLNRSDARYATCFWINSDTKKSITFMVVLQIKRGILWSVILENVSDPGRLESSRPKEFPRFGQRTKMTL